MDGLQTDTSLAAERRQVKKQRALNALIFLLATAVCVQAYVLWETNERLSATVAELDHVKQKADNADWSVIPKPNESAAQDSNHVPAQAPSALPPTLDPFARLNLRGGLSFPDIDRMRAEVERMMKDMEARADIAPQVGGVAQGVGASRTMRLDDQPGAFVVKADLTGIDAANVNVNVEGQTLYICVKQEKNVEQGQYGNTTRQRTAGQCTQRFTLPQPVDGDATKWTLNDGILTIVIPKAGQPRAGSESNISQSVRD